MFAKPFSRFPTDEKFEKILSETSYLEIVMFDRVVELYDITNSVNAVFLGEGAINTQHFLSIYKDKYFKDGKIYHMQHKNKLYVVTLSFHYNESSFRYIFKVRDRKFSLHEKISDAALALKLKIRRFFGKTKNKRKSKDS